MYQNYEIPCLIFTFKHLSLADYSSNEIKSLEWYEYTFKKQQLSFLKQFLFYLSSFELIYDLFTHDSYRKYKYNIKLYTLMITKKPINQKIIEFSFSHSYRKLLLNNRE